MSDALLKDFVSSALQAGASREATRAALLRAGWQSEQVRAALDQFAEEDFVVPVPRPRAHASARDAFLYLVMFSMLYLSVFHLGSLLFVFVDLALPDVASDSIRAVQIGSVRFSVATLLIAWPLFLLLATRVQRHVRIEPTRRLSAIRKWLTWLTLAITACVIAGDLISLVYRLLSGELSLRFLLKVAIVGSLAGSSFGYYFRLMSQDDREPGEGDAA